MGDFGASYMIVRFYKGTGSRKPKIKQRNLTLQEAQAHCNREDTHGATWFDGYTKDDGRKEY